MLSPLTLGTLLLHAVAITAKPVCPPSQNHKHHAAVVQDEATPDATSNTTLPSPAPSSAANSPSSPDLTANSTVPDSGSGNASLTGGVYNPFANPNKTVEATLKVDGKNVPVTGVSAEGVDAFLGIPFAAPPVDDLRWQRPQAPSYGAKIDATKQPVGCMQSAPIAGFGGGAQAPYGTSEDCLALSVLAPEGTKPDAKLPVMVWIYGGAFTQGSGAIYNSPVPLIFGKEAGQPFILVTVNYRLGVFGFPVGRDAAQNKAANLGLHDQVAAFKWVKEHIGSFGGDASRVTGFGESAGAISLSYLMMDEDQDLFSAAILQSGAPSTTNTPPTDSWNEEYDKFLAAAGCQDWECLKKADAQQLLNASQVSESLIYTPTQDGELIPGRPFDVVREGKLSPIPYITGNVRDEGTLFLPGNITMDGLRQYFQNTGEAEVGQGVWDKIQAAYPANGTYHPEPSANATGMDGKPVQLSPDFPRAATIYGDKSFQSRRRWMLQHTPEKAKTWAFEFAGPAPGFPPQYGVGHGSDVFYLFGWVSVDPRNPKPQIVLGYQMVAYWINFAYNHDPNPAPPAEGSRNAASEASALTAALPPWPAYGEEKNSLLLAPGNVTRITDDFRPQMAVFDEEDVARASNF